MKYLRHQLDLLRPAWPDGQREAIALGRRLYAEKPSSLTNRLGRLWTVAA